MGARKWVVGLSVFALLTGPIPAEVPRPVGIVLEADQARAGSTQVLRGASVFPGNFFTDPGGRLCIRLGAAQLTLNEKSSLSLQSQDGRLLATLRKGTASVSWGGASALEFTVQGVEIRPGNGRPAHGAVAVSGPHEFVVSSFSGSLAATYDDSTQVIPAGTSYKAMLDPPQSSAGAGRRRGLPAIIWIAVAAGVGVGLWLVLRETHEPVSPSVP